MHRYLLKHASAPGQSWHLGSPRVYRLLPQQGISVSENRVAKLMRLLGIKGRWATLRYTSPNLKKFYGSLPNQQIEHPAQALNQVWVADITYLKVGTLLFGGGYGSLLKAHYWLGLWSAEELP